MTTVYYALIADVIASRALAPKARRRLQDDLRFALREFNTRYVKDRAARFAITLGDQVQGLLRSPRAIWEISHGLRRKFQEVDWVVAWGKGGVSTAIPEKASADELDGPCFHHARAALDDAKSRRLVVTFGGFEDPRVMGFADYYSALYWSWTARQRRAATNWRWYWDPIEASLTPRAREKIHPSAVSHLRRRMAWPLVAAGDRVFRALLENATR